MEEDRKQEITRPDADDILFDFHGLAELMRHPFEPLIVPAFDLAERTGRTVYDCLYLALAVQLDAVMVTADGKLANALAGTSWAKYILKLADLP